MATKKIPLEQAHRLGTLVERIARLEAEKKAFIAQKDVEIVAAHSEQQLIAARVGLGPSDQVVLEPGGKHEVGTVLDPSGVPIEEPKKEPE